MWIRLTAKYAVLLALASPGLARREPFPIERYRVTQQGGGLGIDVDETVVVSFVIDTASQKRWLAERRRRDHNWCAGQLNGRCVPADKTVHDWIDGDACPALRAVFVDLARLSISGFTPPARSDVTTVSDTPLVTVSGTPDQVSGDGARLTLAGFTGPVVEWWTRSEGLLAPCWTVGPLTTNGQPIASLLAPK